MCMFTNGDMETLRLNIGGTVFETTRDTITSLSGWKLADRQYLSTFYREKENDFFFDRDPLVFRAILDYLRTKQLHLPTTVCGPYIKTELEFWNISEHDIERCCWTSYNRWNSSLEALAKLEHDRKAFNDGPVTPGDTTQNTPWSRHRAKVWRFLNRGTSSMGAKIFSFVSLVFVIASILILILSSMPYFRDVDDKQSDDIHTDPTITTQTYENKCIPEASSDNETGEKYYKNDFLRAMNIVCLIYFTLEYLVRFIYSPRKIHFLKSFMSIIDALALIPDIIEYVIFVTNPDIEGVLSGVTYVTILRVLRILRIFRLIRHSTGLWILFYTLKASAKELFLLVWMLMIGVVFFASLIYIVEEQSDFKSIPDGFWWAIITMTTVGYGDMSPKTILGKIIGSFCAMLGVLVIGFSVPFLVNNFMMYYSQLEFATMMEQRANVEKGRNDIKHTDDTKKKENNNTLDIVSTSL